ncbi:MAG: TPM domain-containing protein, partial [Flavobacterium sp.]
MKNYLKNLPGFLLIIILILNYQSSSAQLKIPEKPSFIPPVIDSTKTLSEIQKKDLFDKLKNYYESTSTEIFVMIVPTTQGEDIARYATDLGHKWEIGQKGKDNGVVFLIAKDDRKMTIQAGYGTEHLLTDALSRRIIETIVKPEFKSNKFYEGIDQG